MVETSQTNQAPQWQLIETRNSFTLVPDSVNPNQKSLTIDKLSLKTTEHEIQKIQNNPAQIYTTFGLLGILNILSINHLVIIKQCKKVCGMNFMQGTQPEVVFKLKEVALVSINQNQTGHHSHGAVNAIKEKLEKYLSYGFFFAHNFDLTRTTQKKALHEPVELQAGELSIDKRYMWNYHIWRDFISQQIPSYWCIPLIQGYVNEKVISPQVRLILIARRRWRLGGTRYHARGIDEDGYVANHCELEQIVVINKFHSPAIDYKEKFRYSPTVTHKCIQTTQIFSFVQVRGSVPTFWEQPGLTQINLTREVQPTLPAFTRHFKDLQSDYKNKINAENVGGYVFCLNLLQPSKSMEKMLEDRFQELITAASDLKQLEFYPFDFHTNCHKNSDPMIELIRQHFMPSVLMPSKLFQQKIRVIVEQQGGFNERVISQIKQIQTGIIRTNCLDCLDRTNVAQQLICMQVIEHFLINPFQQTEIKNLWNEALIELWAYAGDNISKCYSGTESVLTKVTLQGYQTSLDKIEQKLLSIRRFQKQSLTDDFKQECIMILQGLDPRSQTDSIKQALVYFDNAKKTINKQNAVFIKVISMNCNTENPPLQSSLYSLFRDSISNPDIVVVGLQEIIKLGYLTSSKDIQKLIAQWIQLLGSAMNFINKSKGMTDASEQYTLYQEHVIGSLCILLFCKKKMLNRIKDMQTCEVNPRTILKSSNKGCVAMRLTIDQTQFAFLNCRLKPSEGNLIKRLDMLNEIIEQKFADMKQSSRNLILFLFGDLNFRITMSNFEIRDQIKVKNFKFIQKYDEFLTLKNQHQLQQHNQGQHELLLSNDIKQAMSNQHYMSVIKKLSEGEINFAPTYKFDKGTNDYDTSKKQSVPSYCDRICFTDNDRMKLLEYTNVPTIMFSDHKPVHATFQVHTQLVEKLTDEEAEKMIQSYQTNYFNMQRFKTFRRIEHVEQDENPDESQMSYVDSKFADQDQNENQTQSTLNTVVENKVHVMSEQKIASHKSEDIQSMDQQQKKIEHEDEAQQKLQRIIHQEDSQPKPDSPKQDCVPNNSIAEVHQIDTQHLTAQGILYTQDSSNIVKDVESEHLNQEQVNQVDIEASI